MFGVDSSDQIANESYAQNALFAESWVKGNRNTGLFGNDNEQKFQRLISDADVICVYGCSLGKTDGRIWRSVGKRLVDAPHSRLLLFIFDLPSRHGLEHRKYQKVREAQRAMFQKLSGLKDDEMLSLDSRVFFLSSQDYFKMGGKIELGKDAWDEQ